MDPHPAELGACGFERLGADRGQEAGEVPALAARPPCPEGVPEKGKRDVLVLRSALTVLAIDDPRFVRVKPQADLVHPRGDPTEHKLGLGPALAMHDTIVGITLPRAARELPDHPRVERVIMNRFARTGETGDPCGVPLLRCSREPSGCCSRDRPVDPTTSASQSVKCSASAVSQASTDISAGPAGLAAVWS